MANIQTLQCLISLWVIITRVNMKSILNTYKMLKNLLEDFLAGEEDADKIEAACKNNNDLLVKKAKQLQKVNNILCKFLFLLHIYTIVCYISILTYSHYSSLTHYLSLFVTHLFTNLSPLLITSLTSPLLIHSLGSHTNDLRVWPPPPPSRNVMVIYLKKMSMGRIEAFCLK